MATGDDQPTELDLVYEDLHKAQQRIRELEAELGHYKEWIKAELEGGQW